MSAEVTEFHTRILRYELGVEDARVYWQRYALDPTPKRAFEEFWFGAKSMPRVENILANMHTRFDVFPNALLTLSRWTDMAPKTRAIICHWHTQLSDPFYRNFTGDFLVDWRGLGHHSISRQQIAAWVSVQSPQWSATTAQTATSKLMTTALKAGLFESTKNPRTLLFPHIENLALEYLLYLLRETNFKGTLIDNPYLASVGLSDSDLTHRLRKLSGLDFKQQGNIVDFGWRYNDLKDWALANFEDPDQPAEAYL